MCRVHKKLYVEDTNEQSVRFIKCHFERSKEIFFTMEGIYSIVQKGHKRNPE